MRTALALPRGVNRARSFSSQASRSSSSAAPALLTGLEGRLGRIERSLARLPRFFPCVNQRMFAPSLSTAHHALIFAALNAPQRLDLNVEAFLRGAAAAARRVLMDASSEDFVQLVETDGGWGTTSPILEEMQRYCLSPCYQQLQASLRRTLSRGMKFTLLDMQVDSASLLRACYAQLTEDQFREELRAGYEQTGEQSEMPSVERLLLHVEIRTREHTREIYQTQDRAKVSELLQHNVYIAKFISCVTTSDDLDWSLPALH